MELTVTVHSFPGLSRNLLHRHMMLYTILIYYLLCGSNVLLIHSLGTVADGASGEEKVKTVSDGSEEVSQNVQGDREELSYSDAKVESRSTKTADATFVTLYVEAVKAYDDQLWYSCTQKMENAIKGFKLYKKSLTDCRLDCENGVRESKLSNFSSNFPSFSMYSKFLEQADCFRRCKDEFSILKLSERLEKAFDKRTPYQYLQYCCFKLDRLNEAAAASYTYYLANPGDTDTKQNIQYYRDKAGVSESHFLDMEIVPYKEYYIRAMQAYTKENWQSVINNMESCLREYFVESRRCQVNCQARVHMRGNEFSTGVADLMIDILMCKLDCEEKLSWVYTEPIKFFLQDMFHYLNFAYYKVDDLEKSAEATASFLLLNSSHEVMLENREVLKVKLDYTNKDFKPRQDIADYIAAREEMQAVMDFINKNYKWPDINDMKETDDLDDSLFDRDNGPEDPDDWMSRYEKLGMHVIAKSTDLHRAQRFVTDGLLKPEQCEELLSLVEGVKVDSEGAKRFDLKTAQQRLMDDPDEEYEGSLRLLIRAAEVVRHYTQRYINSEDSYYLKYTSIVCWSTPQDSSKKLDCYRQENGNCIRFEDMSDELYQDSFTTVTYLTTADQDSDFLFLSEHDSVDSSFGVKCGRTVGFNTGDRHTMNIPKKETLRCALVINYTTYRSEDEREYRDTISLLHRVTELRMASAAKSSKEVMKKFAEQGVMIVKQGQDDLKGKERFVADGLASDAQCSTLRNMVLSGALVGDGYDHLKSKPSFISPHTEYEMYQGITIYRASKLMHSGLISTYGLHAFLDLAENSRLLVEKYFNLTKPLYFDYTHLVCRTAVDDSKSNRQDLSHPVHADNCILQPDGSCTKDYPAFTQRDYSAILYLNEDFEGGEFFFAHSNKSEQVSLRPRCGRLVGFNAGAYHGVRAVKSGQRCALALWFTHNPNFKELAHVQARKVLKQVEKEQNLKDAAPIHEDL